MTPLSSLTDLTDLLLNSNSIDDVSSLSDLVNIERLNLAFNNISDIAPLVENEGLSDGDTVAIRSNPLDCDDPQTQENIATLETRGVDLSHDCE